MAAQLSRRDLGILEKIRDPESDPSMAVPLDNTLPKDPNLQDQGVYERVVQKEREIVSAMQQLEIEIVGPRPIRHEHIIEEYRKCLSDLGSLILDQPSYASAHNNRAQVLRRLYGDSMLIKSAEGDSDGLLSNANDDERLQASTTALEDLDEAVSLLSPSSLFAALSPVAAKTLSMVHTQRAAIYHATAKGIDSRGLHVDGDRREAGWSALAFEEAASRDFAMGGKYGNEIAKGLAVGTNPTAKLCGQMVREMMRKEYGLGLE